MKSKGRSAIRKKVKRLRKPNESEETTNKDSLNEENSIIKTGSSSRRKKNDFEVIVSESESEESSRRKSQRLNISVAETESEDGIESIDMFGENHEKEVESDLDVSLSFGSKRSPRNSPRKRKPFHSSDESDTDYFDAFENVNEENTGKDDSTISSRTTDDEEEVNDDVDKTQVYYLKTVLVPLKDIGSLLQSYSNGSLTKDWTFCIRTSKTSNLNRPSSSSSNQGSASNSDQSDDDFHLSESSISDSEEGSSSGSNFSWESECESISSSNSWLPKRYKVSSSEEDSDSKSDELEEIEDDFVLHTKKKRRELRKKKYLLRQSNSVIRSKVAKYCNESTEESTSSESSDE